MGEAAQRASDRLQERGQEKLRSSGRAPLPSPPPAALHTAVHPLPAPRRRHPLPAPTAHAGHDGSLLSQSEGAQGQRHAQHGGHGAAGGSAAGGRRGRSGGDGRAARTAAAPDERRWCALAQGGRPLMCNCATGVDHTEAQKHSPPTPSHGDASHNDDQHVDQRGAAACARAGLVGAWTGGEQSTPAREAAVAGLAGAAAGWRSRSARRGAAQHAAALPPAPRSTHPRRPCTRGRSAQTVLPAR